jgi:uncharacterized 2Fe-2S/4Fe-4S cluster protein (DUF4445 family)
MSTDRPHYNVTLAPSGAQQFFPAGTILSDALFDLGIMVNTPCGGKGTCGKCRVRVEGIPGEVMACKTPITRDLEVHVEQPELGPALILPEIGPDARLAAAVDIGTTTVKMSLVDISRKAAYEIDTFFNPQQRFGHDVISRIAAGCDAPGLASLQGLIRKAIGFRLERALHASSLSPDRVERIVFTGNTTMLYLFLGIDVTPLGRHPYTSSTRNFADAPAGELGLNAFASARVHALPVLSAFLGADLIGGLTLCLDMGISRSALFIDLGTNGELFFLDRRGTVYATSCSMGPALEGMNISRGMAAHEGAVTHVRKESHSLAYDMMGSGEPVGMTGTALVDLIAILLDEGVITPGGVLKGSPASYPSPVRQEKNGNTKQLRLWGEIGLTQKDIRNVQLAKGASLTAALFLLEAARCGPVDVEHVVIAGALGEHLDFAHFRRLGFIPDFSSARHTMFGNTSLRAAEAACMDPDFLNRAVAARDRVTEVLLSTMTGFPEAFIRSLDFPPATRS